MNLQRGGGKAADSGKGYHQNLPNRPVHSQAELNDTLNALPKTAPEGAETMADIMADFENIVMPGITHWQHPHFFAYFPSNAAPASILAEFLTSIVAPQCMLWQTSPAATEMEIRMIQWLRQGIGLPDTFSGVIQDNASSATLAAVLVMRERAVNWEGNIKGLSHFAPIRIYCSDQVHTSIDRAIWVAGIGQDKLVAISTSGPMKAMDSAGYLPAGIIAATDATGMGACDDLNAIADISECEGPYTHLDAAVAGSAMICPEFRTMWEGVERFDRVVFSPNKWLGEQFDCAAHFLPDPNALRQTLAIRPEYLRTHGTENVTDFSG
jgi:aromatic-L-amino-acid decarboxylase